MSILKDKFSNSTTDDECKVFIRPIRDVIDIIGSKWSLPILVALSFKNHRFKELKAQISGITPRMLSKELKNLELNYMVNKISLNDSNTIVEYSLTSHGKSLDEILVAMRTWGKVHREKTIK